MGIIRTRDNADGGKVMDNEANIRGKWDWAALKQEAENNQGHEDADGNIVGSIYLGTITSIMPSGKYYMPWAAGNVTEEEAEKDSEYRDVLDKIADEYGGWIESGEGDPLDLYFCVIVKEDE